MIDHRTVHRFMPATAKAARKTACGIRLACGLLPAGAVTEAMADDGGFIAVSMRGSQFDCSRCRTVLERHHQDRGALDHGG